MKDANYKCRAQGGNASCIQSLALPLMLLPAHYLKMLINRMIISKMATKINSMVKKMVTKATRPGS